MPNSLWLISCQISKQKAKSIFIIFSVCTAYMIVFLICMCMCVYTCDYTSAGQGVPFLVLSKCSLLGQSQYPSTELTDCIDWLVIKLWWSICVHVCEGLVMHTCVTMMQMCSTITVFLWVLGTWNSGSQVCARDTLLTKTPLKCNNRF